MCVAGPARAAVRSVMRCSSSRLKRAVGPGASSGWRSPIRPVSTPAAKTTIAPPPTISAMPLARLLPELTLMPWNASSSTSRPNVIVNASPVAT